MNMIDPDILLSTLEDISKRKEDQAEYKILHNSNLKIEWSGYDNWNGGIDIYDVHLEVPTKTYAKYCDLVEDIEKSILIQISTIFRIYNDVWIRKVIVTPKKNLKEYNMDNTEIVSKIDKMRNILISVSTAGARIQQVNDSYIELYQEITTALDERKIQNPNPYSNLWDWYGKWSSGDLPTYQSRRKFISEMLLPLIDFIKNNKGKEIFNEPTGWARIDRTISEIRKRLAEAQTEEQFQSIGLLARENLISLAQIIYDPSIHKTIDGVKPSKTDAKRMLEAYINTVLSGSTNEKSRKHARASLDLANELAHKRTADFKLAALCAEAVTSVVNIIAIISGQRDP